MTARQINRNMRCIEIGKNQQSDRDRKGLIET